MNEGTCINYVVNRLKKLPGGDKIHSQSMTFGSRSFAGTPDRYFDGPGGDLWAEFKYLPSIPRSGIVGGTDEKKQGHYRAKQTAWLERRYYNNRTPEGSSTGHASGMWVQHRRVFGFVFLPDNTVAIHSAPNQWRFGSPIANAVPRVDVVDMLHRLLTI